MTEKRKEFSSSLRLFFTGAGRYTLFTVVFYALWLVKTLVVSQNFELHSFSGRMIGMATYANYDVGARVSLFYKCISLFFLSVTAFGLLGYFIHRLNPRLIPGTENKLIHYSSLAGILLLLFDLFGFRTRETMDLLYYVHKLMVLGLVLRYVAFPANRPTASNYVLIFLFSVAGYFFVADLCDISGAQQNPDFLVVTFVISALLVVALNFYLKNGDVFFKQERLTKLAYTFSPLCFLPLLSVLKDEIFLVLKTNGTVLNGQGGIYLVLVVLLCALVYACYRKSKALLSWSQPALIAKKYLPLLLFSLVTFINYSHFIKHSKEAFEAGNKYLPLMELKLYGAIPTLEKFNSHLLSDYFFSGIYMFFNGMQGREMELYDFLHFSFAGVLFYYLVLYISNNAYVALFTLLFYPLCNAVLPEPYALCLLSVVALYRLINSTQTVSAYVFFFGIMGFQILWRIDLGYTCLVAMSVLLLYYHFFSPTFKISWKPLFKALGIFLGVILLVFSALSAYRHTNLFAKLIGALNYLSSAQTYGFPFLGAQETLTYKLLYFIFPLAVCLVLVALLLQSGRLNKTRSQRLAFLTLLFSAVFYVVNFNRGLIRHSLVEGNDHFTSSLVYLVLPGSVYILMRKSSQAFKFAAFCCISFFFAINHKIPDPHGSIGYSEALLDKLHVTGNINLAEITDRVTGKPEGFKDKDKAFIRFIATHTNEKETFADFTNHPLLYFATKKETPSYFYQNPVCSHNDYLQDLYISDIQRYNTPFIVFSRQKYMIQDMMDDVPNTVRHYRIAEYIYQNYTPYTRVDYLGIWKRNDVKDQNKRKVLYSFDRAQAPAKDSIHVKMHRNAEKKYLARVIVQQHKEFTLPAGPGYAFYPAELINDSLSYSILDLHTDSSVIAFSDPNIKTLEIFEYDYLPDFYAEKFLPYHLEKLPYIWGKLDKKVNSETVLFQETMNQVLKKERLYTIAIPAKLDRTSGNTLVLELSNPGKRSYDLVLWFGSSREKDKSPVYFKVMPSGKPQPYAVRISSVYKWYSGTVDEISLGAVEPESELRVTGIKITKGK